MPRKRNWGSGQVRREASGRWAIRWREHGRREYQGGIESRELAERALKVRLGSIAAERSGLPADPRLFPTLDTLAEDWLARRKGTHRSWSGDRGNWRNHLREHFGQLRPAELDTARVRAFVEAKIREDEISRTTIGLCIRELSTLYSDLCERPRETGVSANPIAGLPRSLRRLYRSQHDPRLTTYLRRLSDVRRLYQAMGPPLSVAFAVGFCAGLRTAEVLALRWERVDEERRRLEIVEQIRAGRAGPLKDDEARIVQGPFLAPIVPVLRAHRLRTGGRGLLFPPINSGPKGSDYLTPIRLVAALRAACAETKIPVLAPKPWYQATRHSMASHWVQAGHPIAALASVLGHSTTWVTERYAHAAHDGEAEDPWTLDLSAPDAEVTPISGSGRAAESDKREHQKTRKAR
jgi:integrase